MSDWTCGIDKEYLRGLVKQLKVPLDALGMSEWAMPNAPALAPLVASGSVIDDQVGICVCQYLVKEQRHRMFDGWWAKLPAGDYVLSSWTPKSSRQRNALFKTVMKRAEQAERVWALLPIADVDTIKFFMSKKFLHVSTKVLAFSDQLGLFVKPLTRNALVAECVVDKSDQVSLVPLNLPHVTDYMCSALVEEVRTFGKWAAHYSNYNIKDSWSACALKGYKKDDPGFIIKPAEMTVKWKRENPELCLLTTCELTPIADKFPETWRVLATLPVKEFERVRFMRVRAEGRLGRHVDIGNRAAGTRNQMLMRLHLPLLTNTQCLFESWDMYATHHVLHLPQGQWWYLDQRQPHAVVNGASVERIHLVVDVYATEELRSVLSDYRRLDRSIVGG